jgi:hypothetical protein
MGPDRVHAHPGRLGGYDDHVKTPVLEYTPDDVQPALGPRVPQLMFGGPVKPGIDSRWCSHASIPKTAMQLLGLPALGNLTLRPTDENLTCGIVRPACRTHPVRGKGLRPPVSVFTAKGVGRDFRPRRADPSETGRS